MFAKLERMKLAKINKLHFFAMSCTIKKCERQTVREVFISTMEEIKEVKFAPGLTADILFVELQSQGREYLRLMSYYSSAMLEMATKLKVLNIDFSNKFDRNPIESIETRLKKPRSIYEKMNRLGLPISVDAIEKNLNDIAGVRVICSFVDDIYKLADMLAVQDDIYVVQTKDYIKNPKESGYRSLHMIVEVQLRTIAMDFWASLEHKLRYKKDSPAETADEIAKQLQDCAEVVARTDKQMYDIRKQIEASGVKAGVE